MVRVAVFASGTGTNLQAVIDRLNAERSAHARVALVVSDRSHAGALARAAAAGIETRVIPVANRAQAEVADETLGALAATDVQLIALAGYLRLVPAQVIEAFRGRIVNIHPALLPAFGGKGMYGLRVHRAVLEAGCFVTGATVHHVVERYDEGMPIAQWPVPVLRGDTPETLAARVLEVEHVLYPLAVEWLAQRMRASGPVGSGTARGFLGGTGRFTWNGGERDLESRMRRAMGIHSEEAH